jgi:hypothetical protein
MSTEMTTPGQAVSATAANDVPFAADDLAGMEVVHVRPDRDDFAGELVSNGHGDRDSGACPLVPVVNVHVCAADSCVGDADQNIIDADGRFGYIFQPQSGCRLALDQGLQRLPRRLPVGVILLA